MHAEIGPMHQLGINANEVVISPKYLCGLTCDNQLELLHADVIIRTQAELI
jgi:hypothetical protein